MSDECTRCEDTPVVSTGHLSHDHDDGVDYYAIYLCSDCFRELREWHDGGEDR